MSGASSGGGQQGEHGFEAKRGSGGEAVATLYGSDGHSSSAPASAAESGSGCRATRAKGGAEDEAGQLQIIKAVLTAVTSSVFAVHDTTLLLAVKTCFYIYLVSRTPVIQTTANATLTQMLNVVFQRLEFTGSSAAHMSLVQRDAFLVFRSLCKLSMKPLPDPFPSDDSIELRSKLLSLQLLYSIIASSGERFRGGEKFVWAIRQYLCLSLLKNGVSPIASILHSSSSRRRSLPSVARRRRVRQRLRHRVRAALWNCCSSRGWSTSLARSSTRPRGATGTCTART